MRVRPLHDKERKDRQHPEPPPEQPLRRLDARRGPEEEELELAAWLHGRGVRVIPVITKADELPKHKRKLAALEAQTQLREVLGGKSSLPLLTSTSLPIGIEELLAKIAKLSADSDSDNVPA